MRLGARYARRSLLRARLGEPRPCLRSSPPPALTLTTALVQELLRSFLTLHSSAKLLSPEGTRAMASVVAWMESYRPAQPPAGTG